MPGGQRRSDGLARRRPGCNGGRNGAGRAGRFHRRQAAGRGRRSRRGPGPACPPPRAGL